MDNGWEGLVRVWEAVQPFALIILGWTLGLIGSWAGDRRARAREEVAASARKAQRQFDLGRKHAEELLQSTREAWDILRAQAVVDHNNVAELSTELIDRIRATGDMVPSAEVRAAAEAVCRLLRSPTFFSDSPEIMRFRLPKAPDGVTPIVLLQVLSVETLSNMAKAFLREENPETEINPLLSLIIKTAQGAGVSVRALYAP